MREGGIKIKIKREVMGWKGRMEKKGKANQHLTTM